MPDDTAFDVYAEALRALDSMDSRQRDAVRRSVEAVAEAKNAAKKRLADQQRMFDRAAADAGDAERLLLALHATLGVSPRSSAPTPTTQSGTAPTLVEVRAQIRDVAQWASDTKPIAESLLRTRARLEKASKRSQAVQPAAPPTPVPAAPKRSIGVPLVIAALIVVTIVVILITH